MSVLCVEIVYGAEQISTDHVFCLANTCIENKSKHGEMAEQDVHDTYDKYASVTLRQSCNQSATDKTLYRTVLQIVEIVEDGIGRTRPTLDVDMLVGRARSLQEREEPPGVSV